VNLKRWLMHSDIKQIKQVIVGLGDVWALYLSELLALLIVTFLIMSHDGPIK